MKWIDRLNLFIPRSRQDWARLVLEPALGRRFLLHVFILCAVAGLLGFILAVEITERPSFCRSCHIMEPYYQSWRESSHRDVSCIECHYAPGLRSTFRGKMQGLSQLAKYFTGTQGTRPWAEVEDASCLRPGCHEKRLLEGVVDFNGVRFDHKPHLTEERRGRRLRCTSCHAQMVMGSHLTVTTSTCITCHFKDRPEEAPIAGCLGCHNVPSETLALPGGRVFVHADVVKRGVSCLSCHASLTVGDGFVPKSRCFVCHNFRVDHLLADHEALHEKHVTEHKVECTDCHEEITHGYESRQRRARLDCRQCHAGAHEDAANLMEGTAAVELGEHEPRVGPMLAARVECVGCHVDTGRIGRGGTEVRRAGAAACISCHGDQADELLAQWKRFFDARLRAVEAQVRSSRAPAESVRQARSLVDRVKRGQPVHNPTLARDLLEAASRLARGLSIVPPAEERTTRSATGLDCRYCHIETPRGALTYGGMRFSHVPHVDQAGLSCDKCHENAPDVFPRGSHGKVTLNPKDCQTCHHWQSRLCESCHGAGPRAAAPWRGITFSHAPHRSAGLSCQQCHARNVRGIHFTTHISPAVCRDCHHRRGSTCGACHGEKGPERPARFRGTTFPHYLHAGTGMGCRECHVATPTGMGIKPSCSACHHQEGMTPDCASCHGARGPESPVSYRGAAFSHAYHDGLGLGCADCHAVRGNGLVLTPACATCHHQPEVKPSCAMCHGDGPEAEVATPWKPFSHAQHVANGLSCGDCHNAADPTKVEMICSTCHEEAATDTGAAHAR